MIRLLLVHEILLMCNILTAALSDEPDIEVVGYATSTEEALDKIQKFKADMVLTSSHLPECGALHLVESISSRVPSTQVLILGITEKRERVLQFVEAGASGYVTKDSTMDDLLNTIRATHHGTAVASPQITAALIERLSDYAQMFSGVESSVIENAALTPREIDVLELLGRNFTNQQIAEQLIIEVGTVKNHVHSILNKLNVNTREEAAAYLTLIRPVPDES
ncbi:MAG: response regulator [Chloroflexota bacterium]